MSTDPRIPVYVADGGAWKEIGYVDGPLVWEPAFGWSRTGDEPVQATGPPPEVTVTTPLPAEWRGCVTASCLAHHRKVFLQGWGPDAGRWCHTTGWPCDDDPDRRCR